MTDFNQAPCGLLVTDVDDVVTRVNTTFLAWTGYDEAEVLGRPFHDLLDAGSRAFYGTDFLDRLRAQTELRAVLLRLVRADGTQLPILVNSRVGAADDGTEVIRVAVFDGTAREGFERDMLIAKREAETSASTIRLLQEAATQFLGARTEGQVATILADMAREGLVASDIAVVAYEPDTSYRILTGEHLRPLLREIRETRPEGARALLPDETVLIHDLEEAFSRSEELGELIRAERAAAFSAIAITDGDELLGAFACLFGRPREFGANTLELHRALAKQAGLAFSHVWLQQRIREQATVDQLTGVANRTAIDELSEEAFAAATAAERPLSLIFLDLDGFKAINDRFGHRAGDRVLHVSAERIMASVREADKVGRFGGDEFLIVCDGADQDGAFAVAERIAAVVREPIDGLPPEFHVTASIGIATAVPGEHRYDSAEAMTRGADFAMYASKRAGRDRIAGDAAWGPAFDRAEAAAAAEAEAAAQVAAAEAEAAAAARAETRPQSRATPHAGVQ